MKVYFVRHGQSEANANRDHRDSSCALTAIGKKQILQTANRLARVNCDLIISSNFVRTRDTSDIIRSKIKKIRVIFSDLFKEETHPSELEGINLDDPRAIKIKKIITTHRNDPRWHYSDEDNFFDLFKRVNKAIKLLESRSEKNIIVISHTMTIRMFLSIVFCGHKLTPDVYSEIVKKTYINNGGICTFELNNGKWKLLAWNEYNHLK